ncbi:tRNA modification GTPase TrmE [Sporothrix schenckii ATCC 58251]|uniref:tRNA modification GTPase TrmE n=2 Tax=Sporothrix schenckii TaxID=29908 RepID=U7PHZ6_SPOS1|nr:tRNA modification GTPase TrmE [Sporothrix schenckii ATCC 58251]
MSSTASLSSRLVASATRHGPLHSDDATIYALSSAPGKAGIAVIRISGPACLDRPKIYKALCPSAPPIKPRYAAVRTLYGPAEASGDSDILDRAAVVLYFPGPKSVTGEDVLELHVHGGPATVKAVLGALPATSRSSSSSSIRYAEPGEFTRRAFLNNRLDLAQVEALGDTLDAATEHQRRTAVRGSSGRLGRTYEAWRAQLLAARAEIEALIDFSEDQHFDESPRELLQNVSRHVTQLQQRVRAHEAAADRSSLLRHGIRIALVGPANAGKSSLMNLIVGREASIVSHEAGTTRDVVEASLDIRGYLCTFADTAGFRQVVAASGGAIEAEGIRRARQKAADADVVVVVASVDKDAASDTYVVSYDEETLRLAAQARQRMVVLNKCDVVPDASTLSGLVDEFRRTVDQMMRASQEREGDPNENSQVPVMAISCRAAEASAIGEPLLIEMDSANSDPGGVHGLVDALAASFASMTDLPPDEQDLLGVTARQQQLLAQCREHLDDFLAEATDEDADPDVVLAAEHLRYAADCLSRITGRGEAGDIEEVLGVIFEK